MEPRSESLREERSNQYGFCFFKALVSSVFSSIEKEEKVRTIVSLLPRNLSERFIDARHA